MANGSAQATLEKLGLDKIMGEGGGNLVKKFIISSVSEGSQEFAQAIAQSGTEEVYKDVDWEKAFDDAVKQGFMGAIVGGGAGFGVSVSENLQRQGVAKEDADAQKLLQENEAKQKKLDDEKRQRELEEQRKIDSQAAESKATEENKIDIKKQGDQTMAMFEQEAAVAEINNTPEARQGFEIIILHPVGYTQILPMRKPIAKTLFPYVRKE